MLSRSGRTCSSLPGALGRCPEQKDVCQEDLMNNNGSSVEAASGTTAGNGRPLDNLGAVATSVRYRSGQEICHHEGATASWYRVLSGVARRYAVRPSGRRQIVGLLLPGDLFGFPSCGEVVFTVEAVVDGTIIAFYPRRRLEALADADPQIARGIREMAFESISRLQEQVFILGRTTALKKVGSFLLRLAERFSDGAASQVVLPISRYDIADYLGLSVETVSRCLTALKRRGVIKLAGPRRLSIVDREALQEGMGGIFGAADEPAPAARAEPPQLSANAFGGASRPPPRPSFAAPRMAAVSRPS